MAPGLILQLELSEFVAECVGYQFSTAQEEYREVPERPLRLIDIGELSHESHAASPALAFQPQIERIVRCLVQHLACQMLARTQARRQGFPETVVDQTADDSLKNAYFFGPLKGVNRPNTLHDM